MHPSDNDNWVPCRRLPFVSRFTSGSPLSSSRFKRQKMRVGKHPGFFDGSTRRFAEMLPLVLALHFSICISWFVFAWQCLKRFGSRLGSPKYSKLSHAFRNHIGADHMSAFAFCSAVGIVSLGPLGNYRAIQVASLLICFWQSHKRLV